MAINADKLLNKSSGRLAMQKAQQEKMVGGGPSNIVLSKKSIKGIESIKINVIKIEDILKGSLALDKKQLDDKKKATSGKRRENIETKLETKPSAESGKVKMPSAPRMGILDFIKNFIGNVLLGYFAVRLIKHLPKIMPIVKFLGNATDFIINTGGFLLNGLATFLDIGYKAYDATRGFLKSFGGENFVKVFDAFNGAVGSVIEAAIIASIALASQGKDGVLDIGMDLLKDRLLGQGAQAATQAATSSGTSAAAGGGASTVGGTATQAGGLSAGAVAAVVAGAGLLSSALGEGAFQVRKFAVKPIQKLENDQKNDKNPFTRFGRGVALNMIRPLFGLFQTVGVLLDIVGAPFRYAIELLRFPFLSEEDKVKQAGNLAKFDARIREDFRKALNMLTLGLAFKEKGSFGNIYGNQGAQKEMMGKMAGGGVTRGGRSRGRVKRTLSKGKYKRVLAPQKPTKTELKTEAFTENKILKESTEELDKTKYFGPILAISSKIMNKEEPTDRDYQNVGLGINLLIAKGIQDGQLKGGIVAKFAEGGLVDPDVLSAAETGGDISNWVAKAFRGAIETGAQKTMRLMKEMREKSASPSPTSGSGDTTNPDGGRNYGSAGVQAVKNFATTHGYSPEFTAGLLATIEKESTFNPYAIGDGGNSYGLFQFNVAGDRRTPFLNFLEKNGIANPQELFLNPSSQSAISQKDKVFNLTLEYMMMKEQGSQLVRDYKTSNDLVTIMGGFEDIERYSGSQPNLPRNQRNNLKYKVRLQAARDYLKAGVTGTVAPPAPVAPLGTQVGNLSEAKSLAESMGLQVTSYRRPGDPGYHGLGRAMDFQTIGAGGNTGTPSQLALANEFVRKYGATAKEIIYTPLGYSIKNGKKVDIIDANNHYNHVHIALAKGGRIRGLTFAMLGERGPEFVFDADTTAGLDKLAPQLLEKLNIAKTKPQLASILQSYAPYDANASSQTIVVQSPSAPSGGRNNNSSGRSIAFIPIPVGGNGSNYTDVLYA
jgi:hypothetical protein